jgi:hypothetical protein
MISLDEPIQTDIPLAYMTNEELAVAHAGNMALLRLHVARYDMTSARLVNRVIDRIEAEQRKR